MECWPPALRACASEREMGFGILECWVNGKIRHITRIQWILRKNSRILGYCEKIRISPHLNALVNLRNNIAHGSFPSTMDYDIFNEHAKSAIGLMESFENIVIHNLNIRNFCS